MYCRKHLHSTVYWNDRKTLPVQSTSRGHCSYNFELITSNVQPLNAASLLPGEFCSYILLCVYLLCVPWLLSQYPIATCHVLTFQPSFMVLIYYFTMIKFTTNLTSYVTWRIWIATALMILISLLLKINSMNLDYNTGSCHFANLKLPIDHFD